MTDINVIAGVFDLVGESPFWDRPAGTLHWVDIVGKKIRSLNIKTGSLTSHDTEDFPTALALSSRSTAIVAFGQGVFFMDLANGLLSPVVRPEGGNPVMRLNEGKCDPRGRFWVASMESNLNTDGSGREMEAWCGSLYRIDGIEKATRFGASTYSIPNTMAWSPDRTLFYVGDTLRNQIHVWDYDDESGAIENRRLFVEGGPGLPDGACMDSEGFLWSARFGGGRVLRFDPKGKIEREVILPASNPTACTFGGEDLKTLFITSARFGLQEQQVARNPLEGAIFAVTTDIVGQGENYCALRMPNQGD
ncbi:SMP-30/gluconolactonase/LRE family protein [Rhizobium sp. KVB221]|uniref:SMP-30/gluconolactonase/LRE family protein n=1 Tax=Rhizobium setariae TaxID=2801340 RepID=A0A936YL53_9HYPH|nr:SMP-30/gluconolactonase/LRE family protein [Rhizobium setariae]MBL0371568.1 SMP-30/gluconolactonase/LRE family protein [Rhizobium setariae]